MSSIRRSRNVRLQRASSGPLIRGAGRVGEPASTQYSSSCSLHRSARRRRCLPRPHRRPSRPGGRSCDPPVGRASGGVGWERRPASVRAIWGGWSSCPLFHGDVKPSVEAECRRLLHRCRKLPGAPPQHRWQWSAHSSGHRRQAAPQPGVARTIALGFDSELLRVPTLGRPWVMPPSRSGAWFGVGVLEDADDLSAQLGAELACVRPLDWIGTIGPAHGLTGTQAARHIVRRSGADRPG